MDITRPWTSAPTDEPTTTSSWTGHTDPNAKQLGPRPLQSSDVELSSLGGYALLIAIMAGSMLLSTWSRIDLRETAVSLHRSERAYAAAVAETSRLELELATLEDPAWLAQTAENLSLSTAVPVVNLTLAQ
jgi:hypothetical protein